MQILLISDYLPDRQHSMLRYPRMLEAALSRRGQQVMVVPPPTVAGALPFLRGGLARRIRYIDKYLIAPVYLRRKARGYNVVHICDHSNAMYVRSTGKTPSVMICHDLIAIPGAGGHYPEVQTGLTCRRLQRWIAHSLGQAKNMTCVSRRTETDLRVAVPDCRAHVRVIPHALNRRCEPAPRAEIARQAAKLGLSGDAQYLLYAGGNDWYKNRLGAMPIFAELRKFPEFGEMRLVTVGRFWSPRMREFAESSGLRNWMIEATDLSDEALNALCGGAAALLFPSLTEGFSWPILETQTRGCPVITTNRRP
jgi:glycosyltransferase involved in cell wall biosynthesis